MRRSSLDHQGDAVTDTDALASEIAELWELPPEQAAAGSGSVQQAIRLLDSGAIRVAEKGPDGWVALEWVKKAIVLYFRLGRSQPEQVGPFSYFDKVPVKQIHESLGVRVVPPAVARFGSYLSPGVVLMPSYVNIGAWVGARTMVDTWATVGSCAQIGADVHLSGGVGIGGVLEPPQATPVVIEDGAFIGSRCIVVEGVLVGAQAVLGANVVLTASTPIIDVTGSEPIESRGSIPPRSVVVPGTRPKEFPAGTFNLPAALVIGKRTESTDLKVSLNDALRSHGVAV
jgi:2,3,4,5-tetrahydropyridine-2,6-dicarboxylate N-succinyltransferase